MKNIKTYLGQAGNNFSPIRKCITELFIYESNPIDVRQKSAASSSCTRYMTFDYK